MNTGTARICMRCSTACLPRSPAIRGCKRHFSAKRNCAWKCGVEKAAGLWLSAWCNSALRFPVLRDAGMSYDVIDWLANNYWQANMVTMHNPKSLFNVDLCGGLPAVVIKMLVDSHPGNLELLPALPRQWPNEAGHTLRFKADFKEVDVASRIEAQCFTNLGMAAAWVGSVAERP